MPLNPDNWKYQSKDIPGLHRVVTPEHSDCTITWIFRLNLEGGSGYDLQHNTLEMNAVLIAGRAHVDFEGTRYDLKKFDSFYLPAGEHAAIRASEPCFFYIGGGPCEGEGRFFVREFDLSLPLGDVHQIHGQPPYQREVFMTLNQEVPASRLICGLTFGQDGGWTSWPPHQHSKDLEEVYCYFDIPKPNFVLHLSSTRPGEVEAIHSVSTGDCVIIPQGYHPTLAIPGMRSAYFWVMVAHSHQSRRYDLAVNDPNFG